MRAIVLSSILVVLASGSAVLAQAPAPTTAPAPTPTTATPAPTPAAPTPAPAPAPAAGSAAVDPAPAPATPPAVSPVPPAGQPQSAEELRKICVAAMNADKTFAAAIVARADENAANVRLEADRQQHEKAAAVIAKNERHVVIAYAAMWVVAAAFLMFLWRRQQGLKLEILRLQRDLDAATKDGKGGK